MKSFYCLFTRRSLSEGGYTRRSLGFSSCTFSLLLCFLLNASHLAALDYYWVHGSGAWSDFANHWAKIPNPLVMADFHANVPTASDDVYFTGNGSPLNAYIPGTAYTVNVDAGSTVPKCRDMDWTGVPAGTVWGGFGSRIEIYGSTTLDANMSITFNGSVRMTSFEASMKNIVSNTVHFGVETEFVGTDGGWNFVGDFYANGRVNHEGGLIETNGWKVTIGAEFYGSYYNITGKLHLGSSEFIMSGGTAYFRYATANFNAGTSHIKLFGAGAGLVGADNMASEMSFYDVSCFASGNYLLWGHINGTITFYQFGSIYAHSAYVIPELNNVIFLQDGNIWNELNYHHLTFTAGKTYTIHNYAGSTNGTDQTILPGGSLTALGAGNCSGFITIKSWQYGTPVNFVNNSGATQTVHCGILEDIHATGSDPLEVIDGVNLGNSNTGWIFTNPHGAMDLYWIGGDGDWNDPAHWSEIDGGAAGTCIPNGATNVHFTALSGFSPGDQVTVPEAAYCLNMDWTGVTGMPEFSHSVGGPSTLHIYGSLKLDAGMNFNFGGWTRFRTSGTATITSAGEEFIYKVVFEGTGTWELQDKFEAINYEVFHKRGTVNTLGKPLDVFYWCGNLREDATTLVNMGAKLILGTVGGANSTMTLTNPTNAISYFLCRYEMNNFDAANSHIIGALGGYIDCQPSIYHDFWDVTFLPIAHAGSFLYGNIKNKLTFLAFGNLIGPNSHIHEVEFYKGSYTFDSHTYDILTIHGGYAHKFQPYSGTGSTVQTITAGGVFNHINTSCEYPTVMHNPTPGKTTTFRKEGAGTAFDIQHTIFDRVYADQTSGAIYTATNCVAVQPDVEASWNMTNPAPRDLYWVGGAGDWHSAAHWSLASGGAGGECPPTAHDDVFFDAASGLGAGDAVTVSQKFAFCKDMDWTGVGSGAVLDNAITSGNGSDPYALNNLSIFGSLTFSSAMTNNFIGSVWLRANGPATITSAGNHFKTACISGSHQAIGHWQMTSGQILIFTTPMAYFARMTSM